MKAIDMVSVSIHAALAGGDAMWILVTLELGVSIHAALAGGDVSENHSTGG